MRVWPESMYRDQDGLAWRMCFPTWFCSMPFSRIAVGDMTRCLEMSLVAFRRFLMDLKTEDSTFCGDPSSEVPTSRTELLEAEPKQRFYEATPIC